MMNKDNVLLAACIALFVLTGLCIYHAKLVDYYKQQIEKTDTITKTDTIYQTIVMTDSIPKYISKTTVKTDTVYTPTGDTLKIDLKKKEYTNTLVQQKDTLNYHAFLTGRSFDNEDYPTLDSITFKVNHQIINTTTIIEKPVTYKKKLITTSPSVTIGYDPFNKRFGAMAGISVNFNIW